MNNPFIAFYPSKWLARTAKLSAVERGVFITLICEMYEGQIPINFDPKRLARFCGTTPATLKKCVEELLLDEHKMVLVDGALWNNRVEKEIITAQKKSENQSKKSRSRWEKTNEINKPAMPRDNPKSSHLDLEPYNSSLHSELSPKTENRFDEFWAVFADKRGKQAALKVWKKKKLDAIADQVISGAKRYIQIRDADQKFWKQAQGWLNDERWTDEVSQTHNTIDQFGNPSNITGFPQGGQRKRRSDVEIMIERGNALRERGL
jgi:uncharacterized protein YdaU (DUF1376 family)